jgi:CelD/BcsL family acetyltransferase involved in cellulose biosynthesis
LSDPRWSEFLQRHPRASVFHTPRWLEALRRTYGYKPLVFTTALPGKELRDGLVFSNVTSWLVRPRLVSLPFSDHVDPLLEQGADHASLISALKQGQSEGHWRNVEIRPPTIADEGICWEGFVDGQSYLLHRVDLRPTLAELFRSLQKDSIQRKVRRAEREGLVYEEGRSEAHLSTFYDLTVLTRRRQGLPPPPREWFRNVLDCMGEHAVIRVVRKEDRAIAAIVTLHFKETMVYKYGCSDARFHSAGAMPFVLWKTMVDAKSKGATELDLGRSDPGNTGLTTFKERFGASRSVLIYKRYPDAGVRLSGTWMEQAVKRTFSALPQALQVQAGRLIYPHIG